MNPVSQRNVCAQFVANVGAVDGEAEHGLWFFEAAKAYWHDWQTMMIGLGTGLQG